MARRPDPIDRIAAFNQGRIPHLLALKYRKMAASPFAYFRGTNHMFHEDWHRASLLKRCPVTWLNGDLHLENFGTYRGDNRLVYFDLGDFDDGCLGPVFLDLARFLVGVHLATIDLGIQPKAAEELNRLFLESYRKTLLAGKARWIERRTASGLIGTLLHDLEKRSQADLLKKRTTGSGRRRRLRTDNGKTESLPPDEFKRVKRFMARFAEGRAMPEFFNLLDAGQRIAGLGTLGLRRYVVLIEGSGGRDGANLVDLKMQLGSTLARQVTIAQPHFAGEAERVVEIENRMQVVGPAFLTAVRIGRRSFTLRELQPSADKLDLAKARPDLATLSQVIEAMGELTASAQLRSSGRDGSATADTLIEFAADRSWPRMLRTVARDWAREIHRDWKAFRGSALAVEAQG